MNAQQLKNSILQLAVQGKLVPQDPNDEPASKLVEKIRAEKEKLIKEKKIKPDKNPSYIFKGSDNLPYEKEGNNEPVCIAEAVPFEIPDSWEWIRLGNFCDMYTGDSINETEKKLKFTNIQNGRYYIGTKDVGFDHVINYNNGVRIPEEYIKYRIAHAGCVLLCIEGGSAGRKIAITNKTVCFGNKLCCFNSFSNSNKEFLYFYLQSPAFTSVFKYKITGIIGGVSINNLKELYVPLPPLPEQERIVDKLKELEPYIQEYDIAYEKIEELNNDFPEQLKKSILQEAVQGKLVPQNPNDEPASVLIERIREEKQKLIQEKKIKKDKNESYIFRRDNSHYEKIGNEERCIDDEIPFDIPDNWEWVRLGTITQINPRNQGDDDADAGFMPMTLLNAGYRNKHTFEIKKWKQIKSGFTHFSNNDIVIAKITPCFQNRKSAIIKDLPNNIGAGTTELHVIRDITNKLCLEYLLCLFKTEDFICKGVKAFTGTAGQQRIGKDFIEEYLIPLPPLEEQRRIVEKIKTLMPIIEIL